MRRKGGWLPGPWMYVLNRAGIPLIPLDLAYAVARPCGDFAHHAWAGKREVARRNYAMIFGRPLDDPVVERLTRRCFRHFALYIAEMIDVQGWDTEMVLDRLDVEGEEHFAQAEEPGKGIIFVSAHMGSAEVAAALATLRGYRVTALAEQLKPDALMDWAVAARARMGVELASANAAGLGLMRALRQRQVVAMVIDAGVKRGGGVEVDFLGRRTVFPDAPARLARLSGAPVVFAVAARLRGGRFRAHVEPPLLSDRKQPAQQDARRITQALASMFEKDVRRYPDQWYVFRDIWPG